MVLAEGSGIIVLEEEEHARARGATIYAELCGYATANSACSILDPEPDGLGIVRTMQDALREANATTEQVDWIHAQGFSIPAFDQMEMRCMRRVFPDIEQGPRVSAVSSLIGNPIGALGGLQAVAIALALKHQKLPAQGNLDNPYTENALRWTGSTAEAAPLDLVLQNSYCFMGKTCSLVYRRAS
jgi:3-oxoacyl-[acyl-carrier-protein] synthase II